MNTIKQQALEIEWQEALIDEILSALAGQPRVPVSIRERQERIFQTVMQEFNTEKPNDL